MAHSIPALPSNGTSLDSEWLATAASSVLKNSKAKFDRTTFEKLTTLEATLDYVRKDEAVLEVLADLGIKLLAGAKSPPKSPSLYKKETSCGYRDMRSRKFEASLERFSNAVANARHESLELSYAFAARSAVFFALERYNDSLYDVDAAIKAGFPPDELSDELLPRRLKCLSATGQTDRLEAELDSIRTLVKLLPKDVEYKSLARLAENLLSSRTGLKTDKSWLKLGANFMDIDLDGNKYVSAANESLRINFDNEKGQMLRTVSTIAKDTALVKETAFVSTLSPEHAQKRCGHCLLSIAERFYPCRNCVDRRYCSKDCADLDILHVVECGHSQLAAAWPSAVLVLKLLLVRELEVRAKPLKYQAKLISRISELFFARAHVKDFESFSSLSPTMPMKFEDKLMVSLNSIVLSSVAKTLLADQLDNYATNDLNHEIFKLMLITDCCKVRLPDYDLNGDQDGHSAARGHYGLGLFVTYSLINHSCDPNATFVVFGDAIYVSALRDLQLGEEITINYGTRPHMDTCSRREVLSKNFGFECKCEICSEPVSCD